MAFAVGYGVNRPEALLANSIGQAFAAVGTFTFVRLSDKVVRNPIMLWGLGIDSHSLSILLARRVGKSSGRGPCLLTHGFVQTIAYGPLGAFIGEQFATSSRYTGASLGFQLSTLLGGGFGPP